MPSSTAGGVGASGSGTFTLPRRFDFARILGKFDYVELSENFALILFDYGQKRRGITNAVFKPPC
jgi:hypothetical protein